ncbi:MAG: hypothetical protein O9294_11830 [Cytophagales bacterium]|jgi:hypothetical protein|nr:hypothetical protein [Cytophagales bacterium]
MKTLEKLGQEKDLILTNEKMKSIVGMGTCIEAQCNTDNCDIRHSVSRDDNNGKIISTFEWVDVCV